MNAFGVDTRSDIYSLGVLALRGVDRHERRWVVSQADAFGGAPRAGAFDQGRGGARGLSVRLPAWITCRAWRRRKTDPGRAVEAWWGELDWIVMQCLEEKKTGRRAVATRRRSGCAQDVEHYLAGTSRWKAGPPGRRLHRLRKAVQDTARRHARGGAFLLLLIGSGARSPAPGRRFARTRGRSRRPRSCASARGRACR